MAPRFTVIQGALSVEPGHGAEFSTEREPNRAAALRGSLHRRASMKTETVLACRATLVRKAATDLSDDPDHLLPLAQPPADRRVRLALVWDRDTEPGRGPLQDAMPRALPNPVWDGRTGPWQPADVDATARVEQAAAEAVDRALRARLGIVRRPIRLVGAVEPSRAEPRIRRAPMADRSAYPRAIPAANLIGIRPVGWEAPAIARQSGTQTQAVRDAVETCLSFHSRTVQRPVIVDPAEASLVRVVSRLFERRGALRDAVLRRVGAIVAGTRHLGSTAASMPWRRARA